jgi:quinol monooxygenase YgiN
MYVAHRSTSDPRRFFLYEQYDDQAALDAHRVAPHFEQYAKGRLFSIIDSRSPEIYCPLDA